MKIIESVDEMRDYSRQLKRDGKIVSLIATDGALHKGHMRLIEVAKNNSDIVISNIDSTIFYHRYLLNNSYDYKYFSTKFKKEDEQLCKSNGVDVLFRPDPKEFFPHGLAINIKVSCTSLERLNKEFPHNPPTRKIIIGRFIHDFNVIMPDLILLGQKDAFQTWVIKEILKILNFPIEVIIVPTVRDKDNVAYTSRLIKIDNKERLKCIYQALQEVASWDDFPSIAKIKNYIEYKILENGGTIKYVVVCCPETMNELDSLNPSDSEGDLAILIVCAKFDGVSFCDNIAIKCKSKINLILENMGKSKIVDEPSSKIVDEPALWSDPDKVYFND